MDVAVANTLSNSVSILLGNGDGTFRPQMTYAAGEYPQQIAMADFNGDGVLDLAFTNFTSPGNISICLGMGNGSFALPSSFPLKFPPRSILAADFNRDGHADLGFTDGYSLEIAFGDGTGGFSAPVTYPGPAGPLAYADINGDGIPDLITGSGAKETLVFLGNRDGTFQPAFGFGQLSPNIAVADFNNDGKPDVAATANHLSIMFNTTP